MANKEKELAGATILEARGMTPAEARKEGWEDDPHPPLVLVLDNGLIVYASRDDEGNGAGALFGTDTESGKSFWFGVQS